MEITGLQEQLLDIRHGLLVVEVESCESERVEQEVSGVITVVPQQRNAG